MLKRKLWAFVQTDRGRDILAVGFFGVVTLAVMLPLYVRGYILRYDMVFAPNVQFSLESLNGSWGIFTGYPVTAILWLVNHILPMDIVQKLLLSMILFTAGYAVFRTFPIRSRLARVTAGFIYMVNPFVYDRFMAGHWRFLLAYAITPFVLRAFYRLFTITQPKTAVWAISLWTLAIVINAHHAVILGILFVCLGIFFIRSIRSLLYSGGVLLGLCIANSWWLVPAFLSPVQPGSFGLEQFYGFQTNTDHIYGLWFNMVSLQGFWFTDWRSIKDVISWWPVLVFGWLTPAFAGLATIRSSKKATRRLVYGVLAAAGFGLLFAAGPAPGVWEVNTWLYQHVPGLSGLREPQKLLALLVLAYVLLAACGIDLLARMKHPRIALSVAVLGILSMAAMSAQIWWGANGQMKPVQYPTSWYAFEDILRQEPESRAIVLPWELYTEDTFAGTLVANPSKAFYGDRVLLSQRMEVIGITDNESDEYDALYVAARNKDAYALRAAMNRVGAKYLFLPNSAYNSEQAEWLFHSDLFEMVIWDDHLCVLRLT